MNIAERLKALSQLHQSLRQSLTKDRDAPRAIAHFLELHSQLHSNRVSPNTTWSYEDYLLEGLDAEQAHQTPVGQEHSITWIVWHLTRIEDLTMNLLVAEQGQVFEKDNWQVKTGSAIKHTGNGTGMDVVKLLGESVDFLALRDYRVAVGTATQDIVKKLSQEDFIRKVSSTSIQRILDEGGVVQEGLGVVEYWSRRDVAGLLLMPPTRHTLVHWNEARKILKA